MISAVVCRGRSLCIQISIDEPMEQPTRMARSPG
jgi:hypothetical protein